MTFDCVCYFGFLACTLYDIIYYGRITILLNLINHTALHPLETLLVCKHSMDLAARKAANLTVLRRHDPAIVDLLDQSSHAVIYSFDRSKAGWVC